MEIFKRGSFYWMYATIDGKRVRRSTKQTRKRAALESALRIIENRGERKSRCPQ
jgi:hypothetical protein